MHVGLVKSCACEPTAMECTMPACLRFYIYSNQYRVVLNKLTHNSLCSF